MDYLVRRGFSFGDAREAVDVLASEDGADWQD